MSEGFLISAYRGLEDTRSNIERIRFRYKSNLKDAPIVVVTTAEERIGFGELEYQYPNIKVIEFLYAPYNPGSDFVITNDFNFKFKIVPRILLSIEVGLSQFDDKVKKIVHLHSDTYYKEEKESYLLEYFNQLNNYHLMAYGSPWIYEQVREIDSRFIWHPESLFFNLTKCREIGFGYKFHEIFDGNSPFRTSVRNGIESLLGEFFLYCVMGKNFNGEYPEGIFDKFKIIADRPPHGEFSDGLCNKDGDQPGKCDII